MLRDHRSPVGHSRRMAAGLQAKLIAVLRRLRRTPADLAREKKSAPWKAAVAATMKARPTATNRWLGTVLNLGRLREVSRPATAWNRRPDPARQSKLA